MAYVTNIIEHPGLVDYGSYVRIDSDPRFPAVTAVRVDYTLTPPVTTYDIYPKFAVTTYLANASDIAVSLSAGDIDVGNITVSNTIGVSGTVNAIVSATNIVNTVGVSGNVAITNTHGISGTVNAIVSATNIANTVAVSGTVTVPNTVNVAYADTGSLDAFNRLRVSQPYTLFDSKTLYTASIVTYSNVVSAANINFNTNDSSTTLATTAFGYAARQTNQRFNYQPGKSQLAVFTGILSADNATSKRYGLFSSLTATPQTPSNGLYFEASNNVMSVWIQNGTNLVASQSAVQSAWNIDTFGAGVLNPSGITVDFTKANIFAIDYQWLGVGRVRFGMVLNGILYYCHQFNNSNKFYGTYTTIPNMPLRASVTSVSATSASAGLGGLKMIGASITSEGGQNIPSVVRAVDTGATPYTIAQNLRRAILGLRLQFNRLDSVNTITNTSAYVVPIVGGSQTIGSYKYEVVFNPTLSSGTWASFGTSDLEKWTPTSTTPTDASIGGTVIASGYGSAAFVPDISNLNISEQLKLGCSATGVRDEVYLVVTPLDATNNGVFGSFTFSSSDD